MLWPLVGRDAELEFIGRLLAEGSSGGVVVAGRAGVGKTRLALEVSQVAQSQGGVVAWVRATRSAASIPLGAFAALLPSDGAGSTGGAELLTRARPALVGGRAKAGWWCASRTVTCSTTRRRRCCIGSWRRARRLRS